MLLDTRAITTALSGVASTATSLGVPSMGSLAIQIDLTYGSGGTSGVVYVQTSLDNGTTWIDIVNFTWATASKSRVQNAHRGGRG